MCRAQHPLKTLISVKPIIFAIVVTMQLTSSKLLIFWGANAPGFQTGDLVARWCDKLKSNL